MHFYKKLNQTHPNEKVHNENSVKIVLNSVKIVHNEKVECLASTYKSDSLRDKLPKRTMYI